MCVCVYVHIPFFVLLWFYSLLASLSIMGYEIRKRFDGLKSVSAGEIKNGCKTLIRKTESKKPSRKPKMEGDIKNRLEI